jgi:hypothetical protein
MPLGRHHEAMVHFLHNDVGYLEWLAKHPEGFVINTYAKPESVDGLSGGPSRAEMILSSM